MFYIKPKYRENRIKDKRNIYKKKFKAEGYI